MHDCSTFVCSRLYDEAVEVIDRLVAALEGVALYGSKGFPLYSWCDQNWTCEHPECIAGRSALQAARDRLTSHKSEDAS